MLKLDFSANNLSERGCFLDEPVKLRSFWLISGQAEVFMPSCIVASKVFSWFHDKKINCWIWFKLCVCQCVWDSGAGPVTLFIPCQQFSNGVSNQQVLLNELVDTFFISFRPRVHDPLGVPEFGSECQAEGEPNLRSDAPLNHLQGWQENWKEWDRRRYLAVTKQNFTIWLLPG